MILVQTQNYWGYADTVEDAIENLLAAGGNVKEGFALVTFDDTAVFCEVEPIHGGFAYKAAEGHEFPNEPSVRVVEASEALQMRHDMITRALLYDVIDTEIKEDLRDERAEIDRLLDFKV